MLQDKDKNKEKKGEITERKRPFDVFVDVDDLFDQFKSSFENMFRYPHPRSIVSENRIPPMDIVDLDDKYEINAELPGISKDNINIKITPNNVEISGKEENIEEEKEKNWVRHERISTSFYRCFDLPDEIKTDSAEAKMNNGVLILTLPKVETTSKIESTDVKIK